MSENNRSEVLKIIRQGKQGLCDRVGLRVDVCFGCVSGAVSWEVHRD